jgi:hypothetical protein
LLLTSSRTATFLPKASKLGRAGMVKAAVLVGRENMATAVWVSRAR